MNTPFTFLLSGAGPHNSHPTSLHDPDHLAFNLTQRLADEGYGLTVATFSYTGTVKDFLTDTAGHPSETQNRESALATILQRCADIAGLPVNDAQGSTGYTFEDMPAHLAGIMDKLRNLCGGSSGG